MTSDDITIDQVLQKDKLQMAVLSSFQWDTDWLWRKVDPMKTKITLIAFAGNEAEVRAFFVYDCISHIPFRFRFRCHSATGIPVP